MTTRAICTIASKSHLAYARTLARSVREVDAEARIFVCLVDRVDGAFDPAGEPFELIEASALGIPGFHEMAFRYDVLELATAVKPFLLAHLLFARDIDRAVYLDADILVLAPLDPVFRALDTGSIALTPHATRPYADAKQPSELTLLRAGAYNLGFIGVAKSEEARSMLHWWQQRCHEHCVVQAADGLFFDQKWIDLVPGFHPGAVILREPGLNVAYWNLHERAVESLDPPRCNGAPLYFFHFSGFDANEPEAISRHQDRFDLARRPDLRELFARYATELARNGLAECSALPYAWGRFADGERIDPLMRRLYRSRSRAKRERFGDPFASGAGTFQHWMRLPAVATRQHLPLRPTRGWRMLETRAARALARFAPRGGHIDNLMHFLHQSDALVSTRFPDPFGRDRARFLRWYRLGRVGMSNAVGYVNVPVSAVRRPRTHRRRTEAHA